MKFTIIFLIAALAVCQAHDFTKCASTDHLGITSVTLSPDPPVAGKNLDVVFSGKADQAITGGNAQLVVKAFGITVATLNFDICKQMGVTCPVAKGGAFNGKVSYALPGSVPSGVTANAQIDFKDTGGSELSCIKLAVKIGAASEEKLGLPNPRNLYEYLFESWRREYKKDFGSASEYVHRLDVFVNNHKYIETHNAGNATFTMQHNEFSALTWAEFRAAYLGSPMPAKPQADSIEEGQDMATLPSSVDWSTKGAVTPIKNQGQCGSCWAFSTTGGLEGAYFLKNGHLDSFSEQMLVDCDTTDSGCNGGLMDNAFNWIAKNGGICKESAYSYTAKTGTCHSSKCTVVSGSAPKKHTDVAHNEQAMMTAVAKQPVSIAIEADQSAFQFYSSGVMTGTCGTTLDHGVLNVGYGTSGGKKYWKVKNSWGASWGASGYILLERGKAQSGGQCGLLLSGSYPTL